MMRLRDTSARSYLLKRSLTNSGSRDSLSGINGLGLGGESDDGARRLVLGAVGGSRGNMSIAAAAARAALHLAALQRHGGPSSHDGLPESDPSSPAGRISEEGDKPAGIQRLLENGWGHAPASPQAADSVETALGWSMCADPVNRRTAEMLLLDPYSTWWTASEAPASTQSAASEMELTV